MNEASPKPPGFLIGAVGLSGVIAFVWKPAALLAGLLLVLLYPAMAVAAAISSDGIGLVGLQVAPTLYALIPWGVTGLLTIALVVLCSRTSQCRRRLLTVGAPTLAFIAWGIVLALGHYSAPQILAGVRFVVLPILVSIVAPGLTTRTLRWLLHLAGGLVIVNLVAVLYELYVGADELIDAGLAYGGAVRTYDSLLRPPGLFVANYVLGGYAAVVALLTLAVGLQLGWRQFGLVRLVYLLASVVVVALSTSRYALIVLAVGIGVYLLSERQRLGLGSRFAIICVVTAVGVGFLYLGFGSAESLYARLDLWDRVLQGANGFGNGWGSAGSATLSRYAMVRNTTDSYFVNIFYQAGYIGILGLVVFAVVVVRQLKNFLGQSAFVTGGCCAAIGIFASFLVTESWEYASASSLAMLFAFSSYRDVQQESGLRSSATAERV